MTELYPRMEALAETEGWKVYAFCVLCLGRVRAAESAAFQSFLYMGESKPPLSQEEEKALLYAWAYRAIGDAKLKKGHKPLLRKQLEEALGTPVSDTIWKFMQFPLQKKSRSVPAAHSRPVSEGHWPNFENPARKGGKTAENRRKLCNGCL